MFDGTLVASNDELVERAVGILVLGVRLGFKPGEEVLPGIHDDGDEKDIIAVQFRQGKHMLCLHVGKTADRAPFEQMIDAALHKLDALGDALNVALKASNKDEAARINNAFVDNLNKLPRGLPAEITAELVMHGFKLDIPPEIQLLAMMSHVSHVADMIGPTAQQKGEVVYDATDKLDESTRIGLGLAPPPTQRKMYN